jgi:hypothetical protein
MEKKQHSKTTLSGKYGRIEEETKGLLEKRQKVVSVE